MKYTENALNIIAAETYKGIGKSWIVKNLKIKKKEEEIIQLLQKKGLTTDKYEFDTRKEHLRETFERFEAACDGIVAIGDDNFPQYRGNVPESEQPTFLFYKGDIMLLEKDNLNATVIGLLTPDEKIEISERLVTKEFINRGACIVSGLANGCDSIAHRTALEMDAKTVAILPSPLFDILPASNKSLAFEIVEQGGLLITEYYDKFKNAMELSSRYQKRDRLQALFSDVVVLAASYAKDSADRWNLHGQKLDCGARLAMSDAKKYGIKRAVIYNETKHKDNPMYDLNREILKGDSKVYKIDSKNMVELIPKILVKQHNSYLFDM